MSPSGTQKSTTNTHLHWTALLYSVIGQRNWTALLDMGFSRNQNAGVPINYCTDLIVYVSETIEIRSRQCLKPTPDKCT